VNAKRKNQPSPRPASPIQRGDQVAIVLAEYSAREQEKNFAAQGILKGPAIAVALLAGVFAATQGQAYSGVWLIVPLTLVVFLMIEGDRQFSVLYHSMYIELIEERLDQMAGTPLLQWARFGSSYHTVIGKPRFHNRQTNARLLNLGYIVQWAYVILAIGGFLFSLAKVWEWAVSNYRGPITPEAAFLIFALPQFAMLLVLFFRVRGRDNAIQFLKEDLRARLFTELPKPMPQRAPRHR